MKSITCRMGDAWRRHAPAAWLEGWTPRSIALEGGSMEFVDTGRGHPLVLLPPLPGFKEAFVPCVRLLARSFRVIAPDLREHFPSGMGHTDRWTALVADLETLCTRLDLDEVALVGHSLGGALAQHWALDHPQRVRAMVLSSSFARVTTPAGARVARFVEQPLVLAAQRFMPRDAALDHARRLARRRGWVYDERCDDAVLDLVRHAIRACPPRLALDRVRLALAHDARARLGELRVAARLLVGECDTAFARASAVELSRLIPGAALEVSPGAGHLHPISSAAWFAERVARGVREQIGAA